MIHNGLIYLSSEDGNMYCLDFNGNEMWRFRAAGPLYSTPIVFRNRIYIGSWDCHLYALTMSGEEVWRFSTSSMTPAHIPPAHEAFKIEIKKAFNAETLNEEDRYKRKHETHVSLSDYHVKSDYATTSDYKQKSDYDAHWVMFVEVFTDEPEIFCGVLGKSEALKIGKA